MFKIKLTSRAREELKNLSKRQRLSIGQIIEELKEDPYTGKPLTRELTRKYSYRIGVYRIIYKVNNADKTIHILTIGHRSTIYN